MSLRFEILQRLQVEKLIGIVRLKDSSNMVQLAKTLQEAEVNFLEITLTMPNALEAISSVSKSLNKDFFVGAGTVTNLALAKKAIEAGARFLVAPNFDKSVIDVAHNHEIPSFPGCLTPSEIYQANEAGADAIKIFPSSLGGPNYLKEMRGPFPNIKFMPTGSISKESAIEFLKAGAFCLGVGTSMINPLDVSENNFAKVHNSVSLMREIVNNFAVTK